MKKNIRRSLLVFILTIAVIGGAGVILGQTDSTQEAVRVVSEKNPYSRRTVGGDKDECKRCTGCRP